MLILALTACTPDEGPVTYTPPTDTQVDDTDSGDSNPDTGETGDTGEPIPEAIYPGTTMFLLTWPPDQQRLVEIDADGQELWTLVLPEAMQTLDDSEDATPRTLSDFEILEDGNLLVSVNPLGVFELTPDGDVAWKLKSKDASHDVDRLANGDTLVVQTWAEKGDPQIIQYDTDGNEVWSWDGLDAYGDDPLFGDVEADGWLHLTGARRMQDRSTWLCVRNFNTVVQIQEGGELGRSFTLATGDDPQTVPTEGTVQGERPHGCEWIDNRHFLVATRRPDRILDIGPDEGLFSYGEDGLETIRDVDLLPNGNYLITGETRIVEVGHRGTKLWEYELPYDGWDVSYHPLMNAVRIDETGKPLDRD